MILIGRNLSLSMTIVMVNSTPKFYDYDLGVITFSGMIFLLKTLKSTNQILCFNVSSTNFEQSLWTMTLVWLYWSLWNSLIFFYLHLHVFNGLNIGIWLFSLNTCIWLLINLNANNKCPADNLQNYCRQYMKGFLLIHEIQAFTKFFFLLT